MSLHYDRKGNPLSGGLLEWGRLKQDLNYSIICQENVSAIDTPDQYFFVSTVWLGIDHRFNLNYYSPPVIFETMLFDHRVNPDGDSDFWCDRACTEDEARFVHQQGVQVAIEALGTTHVLRQHLRGENLHDWRPGNG